MEGTLDAVRDDLTRELGLEPDALNAIVAVVEMFLNQEYINFPCFRLTTRL